MHIDLSGRVAVVTGAARGLGLGIAKQLVESGASVLMVDILEDELSKAAAQLTSGAVRPATFAIDLLDDDAPERIRASVESAFSGADILVNNAGVAISGTLEEFTDAQCERTMAINLMAPFRLAREFVPQMAKRGFGRVLNISSWTGLVGIRQDALYCMTKSGINALTRSIAVDYGEYGVTANSIAPGTIETPLSSDILRNSDPNSAFMQIVLYNKPVPGPGQPGDIATTAAFLVSDQARHITGQVIVVDGGLTTTRYVADPEGQQSRRYLPKN